MENKNIMEVLTEGSEGLKLTKTTKGYTWEIKLRVLDVEKIEKLNSEMLERFGAYED